MRQERVNYTAILRSNLRFYHLFMGALPKAPVKGRRGFFSLFEVPFDNSTNRSSSS